MKHSFYSLSFKYTSFDVTRNTMFLPVHIRYIHYCLQFIFTEYSVTKLNGTVNIAETYNRD